MRMAFGAIKTTLTPVPRYLSEESNSLSNMPWEPSPNSTTPRYKLPLPCLIRRDLVNEHLNIINHEKKLLNRLTPPFAAHLKMKTLPFAANQKMKTIPIAAPLTRVELG